ERLQEFLAKASSLYNSGEYKGAIDAWKEALGVDPGSQKAQEGIRMATLLLGDFEAVSPGEPEEAVAVPADGADPAAAPVAEAEAECKKVFALDATHPGGKNLLKEIRDKIQASLKAAASQLGGMTVKLTMPQAIAAGVKLNPRAPAATPAAPAPPASASAQV